MSQSLEIDSTAFASSFGHKPLAVRHRLGDEPLLGLEALGSLADELPHDRVEHNVGKVDSIVDAENVPRLDASPGDIARGIETNGCWMVLKNIELVPRYRALMDRLLDEAVPLAEAEGGMRAREGFVFLSAPGSVTPSHIDPEHNFLLQVRGTKDMNVGGFPDADTQQQELERFYGGGHRNLKWMPVGETVFPLAPGDGVYVPPHAPHWVKNGDQVSASLSITFQTPVSEQAQWVHSVNSRMRRLRLTPRPPGQRPGADRAKAAIMRSRRRLLDRVAK